MVGDQPMIFYHFHGLRFFGPHFVSNGLADWGLMPFRVRRVIYAGYVRRVREARRWLLETTGISKDLRDNIIRGKGISLASAREIARKAWAQAMFIA